MKKTLLLTLSLLFTFVSFSQRKKKRVSDRKQNIIDMLEPYSVIVRVLPSLSDLAGGKVSVDDLRKVNIKDLSV